MSQKHRIIVSRIVAALKITKKELADKFDISKGAVNSWGIEGIPSEYCATLETWLKETSDPLSRKDLRPDDWYKWWPEIAQQDVKNSEEAA